MDIAKYCFDRGMTKAQYKQYRQQITTTAQNILSIARQNYPYNSGMFYPVSDIVDMQSPDTVFIIQELKKHGMEFYDNTSLWRL